MTSNTNQQNSPSTLNSPEAEEGLLGSILINPDVLTEVGYFTSKMFFLVKHGYIFDAFLSIRDRDEAIDNLTVIEELRAKGKLAEIGGPAYLTFLVNQTPTWIHGATYAKIVRRQWLRREKLRKAQEIVRIAMDDALDEIELNNKTDAVYLVDADLFGTEEMISMQSLSLQFVDDVQYRYEHQGERIGVPTGFPSLDDKLGGGPQDGDLVVLAARPGVGKTALALGIGINAAKAGLKVGIWSMEMKPIQLMQRAAAAEANLNSQRFRAGDLSEREWAQFTNAMATLSVLPIYFDGSGKINIRDLVARAQKMNKQHGLDVLILDYLQLMVSGKPEYEIQELGAITRQLKLLAQELNIPVWCLSQLNRSLEQRQDKRPKLSDLRQSGAIEQDADTVIGLYRDVLYNENTPDSDKVEAIILKQRNGSTGTVPLIFADHVTRFSDPSSVTRTNMNDYLTDRLNNKSRDPYFGQPDDKD